MVQVHEKDGYQYVTLKLSNRWEVWRLCVILRSAADWNSCTRKEGGRWRRASRDLKKYIEAVRDDTSTYAGRAVRPPGAYPNEMDMDRVLNGPSPYPLLSNRDMRTVFLELDARGMSARRIAERLRIHHRTVVRWRGQAKKEKAMEAGNEG